MQVTLSQKINAPLRTVFTVFTDFMNMEKNLSGVKRIDFLEGEGQPIVGMCWRETREIFGKEATEEMCISSIDAPHTYEVTAHSHGMIYKSTFNFKKAGKGTLVSLQFDGFPQTFGAKVANMFSWMIAGTTKKAFVKDILDLKKICEN